MSMDRIPEEDQNSILVTGGNGQLGLEFFKIFGSYAQVLDRNSFDLTDEALVRHRVHFEKPKWVVNCAAYTAVDQAEEEPDLCRAVNVRAVEVLAEACDEIGATLCQISSDYVFGHDAVPDAPYPEDAPVNPQGVYAQSKYDSEQAAAKCSNHLIIRTCGLYTGGPRYRNFVETMLRLGQTQKQLKVVNDQTCCPSYAQHVAFGVAALMDKEARGLYHVTSQGETTWYEFAQTIIEQSELPAEVLPISTEEFGARAPRPRYSVLDNGKMIEMVGDRLPHWKNALMAYLKERQYLLELTNPGDTTTASTDQIDL